MTRRERVVRSGFMSEHIVQFFDTTDSMANAISTFLAEGYRKGDHLLVAVKRTHWRAITPLLRQRIGLTARLPAGRITVLDAQATLARFMRRGLPDSVLFHKSVGEIVSRLASEHVGHLRIYGEMVEVLAEEANFNGAQRLEELWNELATRHSFVLLCGYSAAHFASIESRDALTSVCKTHTHVRNSAADQLAAWLLDEQRRPPIRPRRAPLSAQTLLSGSRAS